MTYQEIKNKYTIDDFLGHFNYSFVQGKSTRNSRVFKNDGDIIITKKRNGIDLYFNPQDDTDNGDLIDFILRRVNQDNPVHRLNLLIDSFNPIPFKIINTPFYKQKNVKSFNSYVSHQPRRETIISLLKNRGLSIENIDEELFLPTFLSTRDIYDHNELFIELNDYDTVVAAQFLNSKMFFNNSHAINGLYITDLKYRNLLVTEHVFDAMAFSQVKKEYSHISTSGALTTGKIHRIRDYRNSHRVHISFDADIAGLFYDLKIFFSNQEDIALRMNSKQKIVQITGSVNPFLLQALRKNKVLVISKEKCHTIYINSTIDYRNIASTLNLLSSDFIFVKPPDPFIDWNELAQKTSYELNT